MSTRDFLGEMAARSRTRAAEARARESEAMLQARALEMSAAPKLKLNPFDVIAELKLRSPAAGTLSDAGFEAGDQIEAYARGGACAVSVLTEPSEFLGSLDDLRAASATLAQHGVPTMRKDFLTDPYQIFEAKVAGAGGVLVIVTMLSDATVTELLACARELGMFVLLEGFGAADLERIAALTEHADPETVLAGVNCRDLRSLQVDFTRFEPLAAALPAHLKSVAESGIASTDDVRTVASHGYRLALVGSSLMTSGSPEATLRAFISAGRDAVAELGSA